MKGDSIRDLITIESENGEQLSFEVEALFDMEGKSYALLRSDEQTVLMRVKEGKSGQQLIQISDQSEKESLLDAYQIAVAASPAE
ncbi:DUF1292 domain-containing protein [Niallia sp. Krafla_26]|uniref:DUF1292 domain-containing protein n=1 Tax=Niallia sp. Krafla_26 TaxID=3064703 RepID=UPI003D162A23